MEKHLNVLVENINAIGWEMELSTQTFTYVSKHAEKMLGYPVSEWKTMHSWIQMIHPEDQQFAFEHCNAQIALGNDHDFEYRMVTSRGEIIWVRDVVTVLKDTHGTPNYLAGFILDNTDQKRLEAELKEGVEKYESLYEFSPVGIALNTMDGTFVEVNKAFCDLTGYTNTVELNQLTYWDLTPKRYDKQEAQQLESLRTHRRYGPYQKEYIRKDGSLVPVLLQGAKIEIADGNEYIWSMVMDISEIKTLERQLSEERYKLQYASEVAHLGHFDLDLKTSKQQWSDELYRLFDAEPNSFEPTIEWLLEHLPENERSSFQAIYNDAVTNQQEYSFVKPIFNIRGEKRYHYVRGIPRISHGEVQSIFGIVLDVTDRKKAELELQKLNQNLQSDVSEKVAEIQRQSETLQQQSKLAAMGEMIGAIAHQWRQPLNALHINIELLEEDYEEGLIDRAFLNTFIKENTEILQHLSQTIDDFRNFFRLDKKKVIFDVKASTQETLRLQSAQLKSLHIAYEISGDSFSAKGFPSEFKQVVLNLINNAKDAIISSAQPDGKITIEIRQNQVCIKDNGGGIEEAIVKRVFEPYFTTKEQGKGTGIGLYLSKMIIENNMGGKLDFNNCDDGVCFIITLKRDDGTE